MTKAPKKWAIFKCPKGITYAPETNFESFITEEPHKHRVVCRKSYEEFFAEELTFDALEAILMNKAQELQVNYVIAVKLKNKLAFWEKFLAPKKAPKDKKCKINAIFTLAAEEIDQTDDKEKRERNSFFICMEGHRIKENLKELSLPVKDRLSALLATLVIILGLGIYWLL